MKLLRLGIYEYDKRKPQRPRVPCARCGAPITQTKRKKYCSPCSNVAYEENIIRNRPKYRKARVVS